MSLLQQSAATPARVQPLLTAARRPGAGLLGDDPYGASRTPRAAAAARPAGWRGRLGPAWRLLRAEAGLVCGLPTMALFQARGAWGSAIGPFTTPK